MERVCIVGSGNWGSAISKIIGKNLLQYPELFEPVVRMWVFEEVVEGRKLSELINQQHENLKYEFWRVYFRYLPGIRLPENVLAVTSLEEAACDATILVFVLPHQFVSRIIPSCRSVIAPGCRGISLIKGVEFAEGRVQLISQSISNLLGIDVSVLMGANIANEVAQGQFCESTLGYSNRENAQLLMKLFHSPTFRVSMVPDVPGVEVCGALKNVVAVAAGFSDGLGCGENTKAAVIRIGLQEMAHFCRQFFPPGHQSTMFESCGVADLVASCYGGRNRRVGEAFARIQGAKSIPQLELEMLGGQRLQGPDTAKHVYEVLQAEGSIEQFPLFVAVYRVCFEQVPVTQFFQMI